MTLVHSQADGSLDRVALDKVGKHFPVIRHESAEVSSACGEATSQSSMIACLPRTCLAHYLRILPSKPQVCDPSRQKSLRGTTLPSKSYLRKVDVRWKAPKREGTGLHYVIPRFAQASRSFSSIPALAPSLPLTQPPLSSSAQPTLPYCLILRALQRPRQLLLKLTSSCRT
ncbi:hypothetical protein LZ32DRAFT_454578 [Colletotrichum eremochloae]|nr:hypothetical protein LZ32DRAFT_454578 [Colletotrichum eremochloae]